MDYEATLNQALDLLADGEDAKAERILQGIIDHVKARLTRTGSDLGFHYYWGRALTAMDEPEQALLRFEKALEIDPGHEPTLWETASIFLHDLDRPESAAALLKENLLPSNPDNPLYVEALRLAEFTLRLRKEPPPGSVGSASGASVSQRPHPPAPGPNGPGGGAKSDSALRDREAALQAQADALLAGSGDWIPEADAKP